MLRAESSPDAVGPSGVKWDANHCNVDILKIYHVAKPGVRLTSGPDQVSMRWKLLVLVSFVTALVASELWYAFTIVFFESAGPYFGNPWRLVFRPFVTWTFSVQARSDNSGSG